MSYISLGIVAMVVFTIINDCTVHKPAYYETVTDHESGHQLPDQTPKWFSEKQHFENRADKSQDEKCVEKLKPLYQGYSTLNWLGVVVA